MKRLFRVADDLVAAQIDSAVGIERAVEERFQLTDMLLTATE